MSVEDGLLDVSMAYMEPFDGGERAALILKLKQPIAIRGSTLDVVTCVLEHSQLLDLIDGLYSVANMREAMKAADRIITPRMQLHKR